MGGSERRTESERTAVSCGSSRSKPRHVLQLTLLLPYESLWSLQNHRTSTSTSTSTGWELHKEHQENTLYKSLTKSTPHKKAPPQHNHNVPFLQTSTFVIRKKKKTCALHLDTGDVMHLKRIGRKESRFPRKMSVKMVKISNLSVLLLLVLEWWL